MLIGRMGYGTFKFFILQSVAITLEKAVASCWAYFNPPFDTNRNGVQTNGQNGHNGVTDSPSYTSKRSDRSRSKLEAENAPPIWLKCVGYVWVLLWFVCSLPFMIDPMVPTGTFVDPRVDFRTFVWSLSVIS